MFETLGMSTEEARERFGFFLEAFAYGPPPPRRRGHLGPTCALLSGVDSIREVIAFPKTGAGFDPLTGAPTPITDAPAPRPASTRGAEEPAPPDEPGAPGPTSTHVTIRP